MAPYDVDAARREAISSQERKELVELRRRNRVLAMEVEILTALSSAPHWHPMG
ncbi:MAG TPA: hypothetical protein VGK17_24945 [Propionicimonas sp.]|jgi:hypothetical protein